MKSSKRGIVRKTKKDAKEKRQKPLEERQKLGQKKEMEKTNEAVYVI